MFKMILYIYSFGACLKEEVWETNLSKKENAEKNFYQTSNINLNVEGSDAVWLI